MAYLDIKEIKITISNKRILNQLRSLSFFLTTVKLINIPFFFPNIVWTIIRCLREIQKIIRNRPTALFTRKWIHVLI